jgi:hypothetical protein
MLLLNKARADKVVIDKLADDPDVSDDMIGFHAQQAVETLLKAVLANRGIQYPAPTTSPASSTCSPATTLLCRRRHGAWTN